MMNVIALAFLVSYFGAVVVLVPEPHLTQADNHGYDSNVQTGLFGSVKQSAQKAVCDHEPCPSSMDQIKDTMHQGYEKTVDSMENAKDSAKETMTGVYQQAKHGVQDKAEQAKEGVQEKAGRVKHGAYETAQQAKQGVQDKAGQVKHGVQETAEKVASHIPSVEDAKRGTYETGEKMASYMPSKEEAISYIPGIETGKETADALKQKVGRAKDRIASYGEDSDMVSYGRDSLDSLRKKLEDVKQQVSSYMQGRENDASYLSFVGMRRTLDEASSYLPSKEMAASYIPGKDSMEGVKKSVQETTQDMKDKVEDVSGRARDAVQETAQGVQDKARDMGARAQEATAAYMKPGEGAGNGGSKGPFGGVFHGMKERLIGGKKGNDGSRQLERRVYDLCSWFDGGVQTGGKGAEHVAMLDVVATRESYAYLMDSALGSIEKAREVFERAAEEQAGGEWREKYVYLADSSRGALEAAKEVFERAVAAAGGSVTANLPPQRASSFRKSSNMTRLKAAAIHTKERLAATLRPVMRMIYLVTFSAIYGIAIWMTFLSGYLLSRTLPRQQLGIVQSKLFPTYLLILSSCVALCAILHAVLHPWPSADKSEHWQYANFALCVGLSLWNLLLVEPRATKMMYEKLKFEKEEGRGQSGEEANDEAVKTRTASIDAKFKGLHQMASCLNLAIVAGLTWHLWYLSNRLVV